MKRHFRLITRSSTLPRKPSPPNAQLGLSSWLDSTSLALALVGADDRLIQASSGFYTISGYDPAELDQVAGQLGLWEPNRLPNPAQTDPTQIIKSQRQLRHKSGRAVTVDLVIEPVYMNEQLYRLVLIRPAEVTALQEKAALLKEIHHRVRNNLHLISNLLDLQAGSVNNQQLSALFATTQNRIQAMTLIHEQLYQSADLGRIDFGEYLRRLALNVFLANCNDLEQVMPIIQVETVWLNLETAVPCGLLVNELLVNSLQHGFLNGQSGKVQIELKQIDQQIQIKVWDNGQGLPADFNWQQTDSLGLKLVRILSKQLKAEVKFAGRANTVSPCGTASPGGTAVYLSFAELKYQTRF